MKATAKLKIEFEAQKKREIKYKKKGKRRI